MKKYLLMVLLLLNYNLTFAEENQVTALVGDIAGGGIDMAIKISMYLAIPLGLISLVVLIIVLFIKKR